MATPLSPTLNTLSNIGSNVNNAIQGAVMGAGKSIANLGSSFLGQPNASPTSLPNGSLSFGQPGQTGGYDTAINSAPKIVPTNTGGVSFDSSLLKAQKQKRS